MMPNRAERLSDRVRRLRAPNPSPMTLEGTNSYLVDVGGGEVLAIDPGPPIAAHVEALNAAAGEDGRRLTAILVTHGHPDHAPAAALLAARARRDAGVAVPVWAHAAARFPHDRDLVDGERLTFADARIDVIDAPGHTFDHLVFALREEGVLFTGDVVLGRGTVVVAPPGGAMRPYQRTLRRLLDEHGATARRIYGGHGPEVGDPAAKLREYIAHREAREREILAALAGWTSLPEIVARVYADVDRVLWPAAARQVLAHLIALEAERRIASRPAERAPTEEERRILTPDLARLADPATAELAAAELGVAADAPPPQLMIYAPR